MTDTADQWKKKLMMDCLKRLERIDKVRKELEKQKKDIEKPMKGEA